MRKKYKIECEILTYETTKELQEWFKDFGFTNITVTEVTENDRS